MSVIPASSRLNVGILYSKKTNRPDGNLRVASGCEANRSVSKTTEVKENLTTFCYAF